MNSGLDDASHLAAHDQSVAPFTPSSFGPRQSACRLKHPSINAASGDSHVDSTECPWSCFRPLSRMDPKGCADSIFDASWSGTLRKCRRQSRDYSQDKSPSPTTLSRSAPHTVDMVVVGLACDVDLLANGPSSLDLVGVTLSDQAARFESSWTFGRGGRGLVLGLPLDSPQRHLMPVSVAKGLRDGHSHMPCR